MTDRTETIGVRVTPTEKQKFEDYLDTEEGQHHTSVSDLMRTAAHRLVNDTGQSEVDTEEIVSAVDVSLSSVTEQLDSMDSTLTVLLDSVRDDDNVRTLAARIYDHLPIVPEKWFDWPDWDANPRSSEPGLPDDPRPKVDTLERARKWSDVRAWSDYLDESEERTQRALSLMLVEYPDAAVAEEPNGENPMRRYYRKEQ